MLYALLPILILLLGPKDAVLRRFCHRQPLRMWHYETMAVALFIAAVVIVSGNHHDEWIGFAALMFSHGRNSVMFRLTESQSKITAQDPHHVECWVWNTYYFLLGEAYWALYFYKHESWAALCGVVVFVGYSRWRAWYGKRVGSGS